MTQLRDLLKRDPVLIDSKASIREAARLMSRENVSSVLVMSDGLLGGIVTDKDLRQRVLAVDLDPDSAIEEVMTSNPRTPGRGFGRRCRPAADDAAELPPFADPRR